MNPINDAYGQEVLAHFKRKPSYEIVERDDGFVGFSTGARAYFAEYKDWSTIQKKAIRFAKGRVLDVGCGAGRVSLYLQKKRVKVTGIDNSPLAIKVCRMRGLKKANVMSIDNINRCKSNSFDTIIMFGNNFGLFGSYNKAKTLLKKLYGITSKNAIIIAETRDPYKTKDPVHLSYHKLNERRGRMAGQLRIRIRFRNYVGTWFDYLLVSKKEMKDIVRGTGWRVGKFMSAKEVYIAVIEKSV